MGYRIKDPRYDRLAKSMVYFTMILYSPGAALGTGIAMFIIGLWPEFWHRWANLFFWPLVLQFIFFLGLDRPGSRATRAGSIAPGHRITHVSPGPRRDSQASRWPGHGSMTAVIS